MANVKMIIVLDKKILTDVVQGGEELRRLDQKINQLIKIQQQLNAAVNLTLYFNCFSLIINKFYREDLRKGIFYGKSNRELSAYDASFNGGPEGP